MKTTKFVAKAKAFDMEMVERRMSEKKKDLERRTVRAGKRGWESV